jgi:tRNA (5-methylaminomethyl-2-thiouridylate)-methyltransferase
LKIAALVSGGVDSSVVLSLLAQEKKHDITAFYLKIWLEDELHFLGECPWEEDLRYVRAVCEQLDIPLKIIPLQREYNERVVSYTIDELRAGRTPSPDIFCNQRVKFGAFLDYLDDSYDRIATGHYASTFEKGGVVYLQQAVDPVKDQSYFLSHLSQEQIGRCLFPLGPLPKSEVRTLAREMNLPTKDRPDSQGICFLGKIKYNDFVKFHLGELPGDIKEWESGKVLGKHQGFWFHTHGQRKGLKLHGGPWFVVEKDCANNIVFVSRNDLLEDLTRREFIATDVNWISGEPQDLNLRVKLRHGPRMINCQLKAMSPDATNLAATSTPHNSTHSPSSSMAAQKNYQVTLELPDSGLSNGQFSVFYANDVCLGSGMIRLLPTRPRFVPDSSLIRP